MPLLIFLVSIVGIVGIIIAYECGKEIGGGTSFHNATYRFFFIFYVVLGVIAFFTFATAAIDLNKYYSSKQEVEKSKMIENQIVE